MTAIVTGASGGIGQAIALKLAEDGFSVAICYNSNEKAAIDLSEKIKDLGRAAKAYKVDVSKVSEINEFVELAGNELGSVEVLVNNAGVSGQSLISDVSEADYDALMDINLKGSFFMSKAVLPMMIHNKSGVIINISSMWGQTGGSCEVAYSASKAGLIGFTKALAKEVGPSGIRVNCVAPGVIDTAMNAMHSKETMDALCEETPLMRIGTPEDIAGAVSFLCSKEANFITGQTLAVNGGIVI